MYKSFVSPIRIVSGEGAVNEIPALLKSYQAGRVMVFADPGVLDAGIVAPLEDQLKEAGVIYEIYSDLKPEPPVEIGKNALQALKSFDADFVIGIGGGSSLDIAKAVSVLHGNEGSIENYLNLSGDKSLANRGLPKLLIPTTAGTGAEVTDISVFSLEGTKDVITHEFLLADVAVVDPDLTMTVPPKVTAATGVDALTHAVEAYISVNSTPLTDALALDAMERIAKNIRTAVWNGSNKEARAQMSWGSMTAGLSFYNAGVAGVHALAYPLGGLFKIPHGESNAVLLPYIFDYIWPSCMEKMGVIAGRIGANTEGLSKREAAIAGVRELKNIVEDVGIPSTLEQFGIKESDLVNLAESGEKQTRLLARSPKPYSYQDILGRYEAAYAGILEIDK